MIRSRGRDLAGVLLLLGLGVGEGVAQEGCEFLEGTGDYTVRFGITYIQSPRLRCRDGLRIVADSAVHYDASRFYQLFGHVLFENTEVHLQSGEAQYYEDAGRIAAQQAVRLLRKADSTVVTGENLEYLQVTSVRTQERLTVTGGRPHAVLYPRSQGSGSSDSVQALPYEVDADRIFVLGDQHFQANGTVEIQRGDLDAFGESVEYNGDSGQLVLREEARVEAEAYDLVGEMIVLEIPGEEIREVIARERGVLTGQDLEIKGPLIRLYFTEGAMERLVAMSDQSSVVPEQASEQGLALGIRGALEARERALVAEEEHPSQPVAVAEGFTITADSLDVAAPGEVLETIHAVGEARAVSSARDSLNREDTPELARNDWIAGDTVVATLSPRDTLPSPASSGRREYLLDRLVATSNASSLYRITSSDSTQLAPDSTGLPPSLAIHYVRGDAITIVLEKGEVRSMEVAGQTTGVHMEPSADSEGGTAAEPPAPTTAPTETGGAEEDRPPGRPPGAPGGRGSGTRGSGG